MHQLSMCQHERPAAELSEEREARLYQMSTHQHERLAAESSKERRARLHQLSTHCDQHSQLKSASLLLTYYLLLVRALELRLATLYTGPASH